MQPGKRNKVKKKGHMDVPTAGKEGKEVLRKEQESTYWNFRKEVAWCKLEDQRRCDLVGGTRVIWEGKKSVHGEKGIL